MIRHVAGIAEIVDDIEAAISFYQDVLGLEVQHEQGSGYAEVKVSGLLGFGIWLRSRAAEITLGDPGAAERIPLGFTVGFEVDAVDAASEAIKARVRTIVQAPQKEPWGQTTSRFFSPSGALCEVSETPWARAIIKGIQAEAEPK
jgi:catechol 2,3-dioxygenase-like lactoylglutathione lyase family enzyme